MKLHIFFLTIALAIVAGSSNEVFAVRTAKTIRPRLRATRLPSRMPLLDAKATRNFLQNDNQARDIKILRQQVATQSHIIADLHRHLVPQPDTRGWIRWAAESATAYSVSFASSIVTQALMGLAVTVATQRLMQQPAVQKMLVGLIGANQAQELAQEEQPSQPRSQAEEHYRLSQAYLKAQEEAAREQAQAEQRSQNAASIAQARLAAAPAHAMVAQSKL